MYQNIVRIPFFSPLGIALCAPRDCNSFDTGCFRLIYIHLFTLKPHRVRILQLPFGYMTTEKHDFFSFNWKINPIYYTL